MKCAPVKPSCEAIIDIFPDPFVIIDRDFHIVSANQHYKQHYQVGNEDVVGKHCYEISHRTHRPCSQMGEHCPLEAVVETGKPTTVMHIHCTGDNEEHVQILAAPIFDAQGAVLYMGETIRPLPEMNEDDRIIIGRSPPILHLISMLHRVATTQSTVFLLGESGTGKDCAARYIHQYSDRNKGPFMVVDCGALGESLIESELFGYEKGAFTGAHKQKPGLFEAADQGTLFIDELGELPLHLQTKLLRVLETGTIRRIGGTEYIDVDVRIIAATNRDPQEMLEAKTIREDLYYRLSAFPVKVPTLRERKEDVPGLAEFFLKRIDDGDNQIPLSPDVIERLLSYDYPGNVRELRNIMERAVILAAGAPILPEFTIFTDASQYAPRHDLVPVGGKRSAHYPIPSSRLTREQVTETLLRCGGHRAKAAQLLGVSERTIYRHLKKRPLKE